MLGILHLLLPQNMPINMANPFPFFFYSCWCHYSVAFTLNSGNVCLTSFRNLWEKSRAFLEYLRVCLCVIWATKAKEEKVWKFWGCSYWITYNLYPVFLQGFSNTVTHTLWKSLLKYSFTQLKFSKVMGRKVKKLWIVLYAQFCAQFYVQNYETL